MNRHWIRSGLVVCAFAASQAYADDGAAPTGRLQPVRGSSLYVEVFGNGKPVVFLHGGIVYFDNNFAKQRDYFASFRKVIGFDRRGHGHSPDDDRPFTYQDMADDAAALIEQLGVGPVDVIGHSDGGDIGLILARDHPELVRRLVVSGANLRGGLAADVLRQRLAWSTQQLTDAAMKLAERLPPYFRTDYQKVTPDGPEHWPVFMAKSYRLWLTPVVIPAADLKTIKIPVLVIAGDHDFSSIEDTTEIFRALPKGELFIVPHVGHGTFEDRPELVNLAIREFLERPESGKATK